MAIHDWASMSWPAFRALPADRAIAVLPLGAIEAHGPHLPLGTDLVIAGAMARAGAERLARQGYEVVLLPGMAFAPAPFAAAFQGTIDTPAPATTEMIAGVASSVARHGVRLTVIANAHHDPAHVEALRDAVRIAAGKGSTLVFPDLTRRQWAARLTPEFQSGACHAGRYEGSIVLAEAAGLVDTARMQTLAPNPRSLVDAIRRGDSTFTAAGGPEAYFGWPADASAAEGQRIIDELGAILEDAVQEALANEEQRTKNEEPNEGRRNTERNDERRNEERNAEQKHRGETVAAMDGRDASLRIVNPAALGMPRGFSHGVAAPAGWSTLAVAGQTASNDGGDVSGLPLSEQFDRALSKAVAVVHASGSQSKYITRMTVFVTDLASYRASREALSSIWRRHMGRYYPAMTLVEVRGLVDAGAIVEIQVDAVIPPGDQP
jgi:creatinine amidohydrolase